MPIWIHVVSDGATGNISQSVIDKQMNVLNLAFAGFYGGAKSGFSFTLAGVTRTDNAAWYNARAGGNAERDMKKTLHRGGFETLNVYTNLAGGFLGYAYLPGPAGLASLAGRDRAQLGVDAGRVADVRRPLRPRLDARARGRPLVQPRAHVLRRLQREGRLRRRHAADAGADERLPEGKDTCAEPGLDPIHNYMDYSDDACYTEFTAGQVARMQDAWLFHRASDRRGGGGHCSPPPLHSLPSAPVAQGIERSPPEREVGGSNPPGRII